MGSIERRREQVLDQLLDTFDIKPNGPESTIKTDARSAAIELVCEKRMTRNILDRIEDLMLCLDGMWLQDEDKIESEATE